MGPCRHTDIIRSQSAELESRKVLSSRIAALLTRMSTGPSRPSTSATMRLTAPATAMSAWTPIAAAAECRRGMSGGIAVDVHDGELGAAALHQPGGGVADAAERPPVTSATRPVKSSGRGAIVTHPQVAIP